jgi:hypothetical protein
LVCKRSVLNFTPFGKRFGQAVDRRELIQWVAHAPLLTRGLPPVTRRLPHTGGSPRVSKGVFNFGCRQGRRPAALEIVRRAVYAWSVPAKDLFHDCVKRALIKDGRTVTHDPLRLDWEDRKLYVDLDAEKLLAAEKGNQQIAVEIKSFVSASEVRDVEGALGQYFLYLLVLRETMPQRKLYLAVPSEVSTDFFHDHDLGGLATRGYNLPLVVVENDTEEVVQWIN